MAGIMRDQQQGVAAPVHQFAQQVHDAIRLNAIQVARGFVGQQDHRIDHQRASNGDSLLFATGKMLGEMMAAMRQTDTGQRLRGPPSCFPG